jgi:hypothetical protein
MNNRLDLARMRAQSSKNMLCLSISHALAMIGRVTRPQPNIARI